MSVGHAGDWSAIGDDWAEPPPSNKAASWQTGRSRRAVRSAGVPPGLADPHVCPRLAPLDERNVASLVGRNPNADSG